ncbi:MAG: ABC transporter ATP-binding protein, partial [Ralstonia sp.]
KVAKLTAQVAKATACGQRVAELFALEPAVRSAPDARELGPIAGTVDFERVDFTYEGNRPALSDVTLHVAAGERVAIVGPTGAGKSTLMKLLLRFHDPQEGRVQVDGDDLRDVTIESLRRQIGWVHQDTVLFGMSVAENITLGRVDASEALVRDVAARVHADEFIEKLPDGYDTVLGQEGATLSGGQRQRLALARALLREPRILLLDEPATGLDPLTRRVVEQAWLAPTNNATTLVIAHRFHDMNRFDRVVFLSDGRVCAIGPHEELLKSSRDYAALVAAGTDGPHSVKLSEYLAS